MSQIRLRGRGMRRDRRRDKENARDEFSLGLIVTVQNAHGSLFFCSATQWRALEKGTLDRGSTVPSSTRNVKKHKAKPRREFKNVTKYSPTTTEKNNDN